MKFMVLAFLAFTVLFHTVLGHTVFTTLFVDDVNQGDGTCVRMPKTPNNVTFPINDLDSTNMACGYDGTTGVSRVCSVSQSAKLSFQFRTTADGSEPGSLDVSHKGPCAVYMKRVQSAIKDKAAGDGWFKIWDEGYDSATSEWCSDKLIKNNGFLSVKLPAELSGGYYLVRPELLSLQQADKTPPNPQFYAGCAQIFLDSKQHVLPRDTVSIPGYVSIKDPSVLFNIYTEQFPYPIPGPKPYTSNSAKSRRPAVASQIEGLLPEKAVLVNANWWGVEVPSYTTEDGCLKSSQACWAQCTVCYDKAPPTGSKGCRIWEQKCTQIANTCNENSFNGPPDAGKNLNPPVPVISGIPAAANDAASSGQKVNETQPDKMHIRKDSESDTTSQAAKKISAFANDPDLSDSHQDSDQKSALRGAVSFDTILSPTILSFSDDPTPLLSKSPLSRRKKPTETSELSIMPIKSKSLTIIPAHTSTVARTPSRR